MFPHACHERMRLIKGEGVKLSSRICINLLSRPGGMGSVVGTATGPIDKVRGILAG